MTRKGSRLDWRHATVRCSAACIPPTEVETKTQAVEVARKHKQSGCEWTLTVQVPIEVAQ